MGIRRVRTAAAPELIPGEALPFAHPTMAHDMTQRAAMGFAVHLAPGGLCGAVKGILRAIPTGGEGKSVCMASRFSEGQHIYSTSVWS
jgi:hypothetical protein